MGPEIIYTGLRLTRLGHDLQAIFRLANGCPAVELTHEKLLLFSPHLITWMVGWQDVPRQHLLRIQVYVLFVVGQQVERRGM